MDINFLFPDGSFKPHPALIVSNDILQENEEFIYLALISSKSYNSQYCFELKPEMIDFKMKKVSYVKCQIIVGNIERDIIKKIGHIKKPFIDEIIEKIIISIF